MYAFGRKDKEVRERPLVVNLLRNTSEWENCCQDDFVYVYLTREIGHIPLIGLSRRSLVKKHFKPKLKGVDGIMFTLFDHQEIQDRYLRHAIAKGIAKEIAKRKAKLSELEAELARRKTELARREAELARRKTELDKRVVMAVLEQTKLIVKRLLAKGLMSHEDIAECAGLPLSEVESLAKKTRKRTK